MGYMQNDYLHNKSSTCKPKHIITLTSNYLWYIKLKTSKFNHLYPPYVFKKTKTRGIPFHIMLHEGPCVSVILSKRSNA